MIYCVEDEQNICELEVYTLGQGTEFILKFPKMTACIQDSAPNI